MPRSSPFRPPRQRDERWTPRTGQTVSSTLPQLLPERFRSVAMVISLPGLPDTKERPRSGSTRKAQPKKGATRAPFVC